ncbi:MAG: AraC family transcriptional regulator [Schleiferiaceae bacterium]|nr:AraC family transcriptional regulator [Schleiferiaceae bacterium]
MNIETEIYNVEGHDIFGRAFIQPPFEIGTPLLNEARFVYIVKGKTHLYTANQFYEFSSGESFLMKSDNFLNKWQPTEDGEKGEAIIMQFNFETLKIIYNNQLPDVFAKANKLDIKPIEKIDPNPLMSNYVSGLTYYLNTPNLINDDLIKIKLQELIMVLLSTDTSGRIKTILNNIFHTTEYKFQEIIHSHLFDDLKLEDLAFLSGLSLSSFKRKFKSLYNTSPTQYIKTKRLEKAMDLLATTNHRISEIAFDCGFNDLSYFSKSFTAQFNISPSAYREKHVD